MRFDAPDDLGLTEDLRVTLVTSCGDIVLELVPEVAPRTVNSFVFLAEQGYFDGTAVHRIVPGFVIQAGDPTASGAGGPGYVLPDELPPADFRYAPGIVAMANAGPNTSGSQFFLVIGETGLAPTFSVFGAIVHGADALMSIAAVPLGLSPRGELSRPLETIYIESVTVER
jgi:cyclophilin family peptidyl-prolyl cis-trans isomerase